MVSSVSFPWSSTKHWPTKAVVESGKVQVMERGLRACTSRQGNLGHLILADRQANTTCYMPWTERWTSLPDWPCGPLPHLLDRELGISPAMPLGQTDRHPHHLFQTTLPPTTDRQLSHYHFPWQE